MPKETSFEHGDDAQVQESEEKTYWKLINLFIKEEDVSAMPEKGQLKNKVGGGIYTIKTSRVFNQNTTLVSVLCMHH